MSLFRKITNEKGNVLAMTAMAMVFLIGCAAISLDVGLLYIERARIVNAIDSAVLAGVQYLPERPEQALQTAASYAQMNDLQVDEFQFQLSDTNFSIIGQVEREVPLHFARIFNQELGLVKARASARVASTSAVNGIVPFGVSEGNYQFGDVLTLKRGAGTFIFPGWYGCLALGGTGADIYEKNIKFCYNDRISIGDFIPIETGNMSGPTATGIKYRIDQCQHTPRCTINSFVDGCSRILIVPIVRVSEPDSGSVEVVNFAAFLASNYIGNGNENAVEGAFVRYVVPGEIDDSISGYGLYSSYLYE